LRILFLTRRSISAPVRVALMMIALLVGLAVLGALVRGPIMAGLASVSRTPTAVNTTRYARLPNMTVTLGGSDGRSVDLKVQLELDPSVETLPVSDDITSRIADRIGDRIREIDPAAIRGTGGALLVKNAVSGAVTQEYGKGKIRAVLLEGLLVH
jgi:hypothetical protein